MAVDATPVTLARRREGSIVPGHARRDIVREGEIGIYHCFSRCVQRAFLCGEDFLTGNNYEHRRTWIQKLLQYQASVFAVDVGNYSILSNHLHLIARTRPDIAATWSDEEVAWRWKLAWPGWVNGDWIRQPTDEEIEEVLAKPERIPKLRANLASLSWFLARWKEPIARLANGESGTSGHFFEQRFRSREILDDAANLCCNVYVDLNQLQAGMATSLDECTCSAIHDRLLAWRRREALESVEHFESGASEDYVLTVSNMEQLLEDCFLVPIGDRGPSLLLGAADAPGMQGPVTIVTVTDTDGGVDVELPPLDVPKSDDATTDPDRTPEPQCAPAAAEVSGTARDTGAAAVAPSQRPQPRRPQPTRRIHARLQRFRRKRASDNLFLGMPCRQYLELVQWTARQLTAEEPQPPPDEWQAVFRSWGIAPSRWCHAVQHFGELFHRAAGHLEKLAQVTQRVGAKWLQGQRACGDVFT